MRGAAARAGGAAEVREVAGRGARLVKTTAVEFGDGNCQYEEQHQPRPERNKTARRAPRRSDGGASQAHLPTSLRRVYVRVLGVLLAGSLRKSSVAGHMALREWSHVLNFESLRAVLDASTAGRAVSLPSAASLRPFTWNQQWQPPANSEQREQVERAAAAFDAFQPDLERAKQIMEQLLEAPEYAAMAEIAEPGHEDAAAGHIRALICQFTEAVAHGVDVGRREDAAGLLRHGGEDCALRREAARHRKVVVVALNYTLIHDPRSTPAAAPRLDTTRTTPAAAELFADRDAIGARGRELRRQFG